MQHHRFVSSRQGEFHPEPLTEPYVIVSHHTALLIQLIPLIRISKVPVVKQTRILFPNRVQPFVGFR